MRISFQIGPAVINMAADLPPRDPRNPFYAPFEIPPSGLPDLAVRIRFAPPPEEKGLSQAGEYEANWRLFHRSKGWRLEIFDSLNRLEVKQTALISQRFDEMDLYLPSLSKGWHLGEAMQPLIPWWLTGWLGMRRRGVVLHGSAVAREGTGWAFFGPSGAGKTTLTRLCLDSRKEGWTVLNDERIVLWEGEEEGWRVAGTPWAGMLGKVSFVTMPLGGLFILKKAAENRVIPSPLPGFMAQVLSEAFHPIWSREAVEGLLSTAARLAERLPIGEFHFLKDSSAVAFLEGFLPRSCAPSPSISR